MLPRLAPMVATFRTPYQQERMAPRKEVDR